MGTIDSYCATRMTSAAWYVLAEQMLAEKIWNSCLIDVSGERWDYYWDWLEHSWSALPFLNAALIHVWVCLDNAVLRVSPRLVYKHSMMVGWVFWGRCSSVWHAPQQHTLSFFEFIWILKGDYWTENSHKNITETSGKRLLDEKRATSLMTMDFTAAQLRTSTMIWAISIFQRAKFICNSHWGLPC